MSDYNAAYWIEKAEEARRRAGELRDPWARETMLGIAAKYDAMAERARIREAQPPTGPDPSPH